ncbi:ig-like domain-containing protein [Trichonephila inaurata madagascariensis]|uniref:Ig-like domain-containing protein n=1 Tax=Trichonephila inaurata madagascariensis TaxID=2747483 RepID=A0A8X7C9W3_9ARAC|nr:ig-like domain-containing protein [Trichonephila inaurata madagascariensis]
MVRRLYSSNSYSCLQSKMVVSLWDLQTRLLLDSSIVTDVVIPDPCLQKSVQGHVYLTKTDLDTEGIYRCEASAESPTFQTVEAEKPLKVFVIPQEDPEIEGSQSRYEVGDYVNVTCKSGPSKPAAVLKWYINGKEAEPGKISFPIKPHNNLKFYFGVLW